MVGIGSVEVADVADAVVADKDADKASNSSVREAVELLVLVNAVRVGLGQNDDAVVVVVVVVAAVVADNSGLHAVW